MPVGILKLWSSFHGHTRRKEIGGQKYANANRPIKLFQLLLQSSNKVEKINYSTANPAMYILG